MQSLETTQGIRCGDPARENGRANTGHRKALGQLQIVTWQLLSRE